MSKLPTRTTRIRFKRAFRGYPAGAVIAPPAAAREIFLQTKTLRGEPVAEIVPDEIAVAESAADASEPVAQPKKRGRPPKAKK